MKITIVAWVCLLVAPAIAQAQGARLQLDHLDRLAGQASESVNVALDPAMIKLASGFVPPGNDQAALKEMLAGLKAI